MAAFSTARDRANAVDEWLAEREQALREQAAQRREEERVVCGRALRAMCDRGQSVVEIARMAGVTEKAARELIREADAAPDGDGPGSPPPAAGAPDPRSQVVVQSQGTEQGAARGDGGAMARAVGAA